MAQHSEYREEFDLEHPHSYDHSEPKYSLIAILGVLTVVLLILVGIGIQGYQQRTEENIIHRTVLSRDNIQLQELRNRERWELTHYGIEDKQKGTVRIPIDQAMRLVLDDAKAGRVHYPTNPYPVKTEEEIGNLVPPVARSASRAAS